MKEVGGIFRFSAMILAVVLALLLAFFGVAMGLFFVKSGEGRVSGMVVKLSEKGMIWKTWETDIAVTQSGAVFERRSFSVDAGNRHYPEIVHQLQEASRSGKRVILSFETRLGMPHPWRAETSSICTGVHPGAGP